MDRGDEDGVGVRVHPVRLLHAGAVPQGALHPPCAAGQADGKSPLIGPGQGESASDVSERTEPMVRGISREPAAVPDKALQQGRGPSVTSQQFEADKPLERLGDALAQQAGQRLSPSRSELGGAFLEEVEHLLPRDPREGREQPARQGRLVPGVRGRAQQRDDVAHLAAGKVFRASVQPNGDPLRRECALQKAVMVPIPEQHCKVPPACGPKPPLRLVPHGAAGADGVPDACGERRGQALPGVRLAAAGAGGEQDRKGGEGPPAARRWGLDRDERLVGQPPQPGGGAEPGAPDMGEQAVDPPQEGAAGPEAHVQLDPLVRLRDGPGEERRVRVAEAVDGLFGVPDGEEPRASALPQGLQQGELEGVRVLELVHQDVAELPGGTRPLRRAPGVEDHVGERQEPSPPLHLVPQAPGRPAETEERGAQAAFRLREGLLRGRAGEDGKPAPLLFLAPIAHRRPQDVPDGAEELSRGSPEVPNGAQDVQREEAQGLVVGLPCTAAPFRRLHPRHPELRAVGEQRGGALDLALRAVLMRLVGKLARQGTEHRAPELPGREPARAQELRHGRGGRAHQGIVGIRGGVGPVQHLAPGVSQRRVQLRRVPRQVAELRAVPLVQGRAERPVVVQGGGGGAQPGVPAEPRHSAEVRPLHSVPYRVPEGVLLRAADDRRAGVQIQRQAGLPDHPCREGVDGRDPRLAEPVRHLSDPLHGDGRARRGEELADAPFDAFPHLAGRRLRVGEGQDVARQAFRVRQEQARVSAGEHPGLARPGPGPHRDPAGPCRHGGPLPGGRVRREQQGVPEAL